MHRDFSDARNITLKRIQKWIIVSLALISCVFLLVKTGNAAVTLLYFQAIGQPGQVILLWESATELDNAGYFVNRSLNSSSGYSRVSPFIPSESDGLTGAIYTYVDSNVTNGTAYWYKLEMVDTSQNSTFYEPPQLAVPGVTLTFTPSPTHTSHANATRTATGTSLAPTLTSTSSGTRTPTLTATTRTSTPASAYPGPATGAPSSLQTLDAESGADSTASPLFDGINALPDGTEIITVTATLLPFPELTLQFPEITEEEDISSAGDDENPSGLGEPSTATWFTPDRIVFLGFIFLIWILLGVWYIFTMRRLE